MLVKLNHGIKIIIIISARYYAYHFTHDIILLSFEKVSHFDMLSRLESLTCSVLQA